MVDGVLVKRDIRDKYPSKKILRNGSRIEFPASKVEKGLYTCKWCISDL